jgi:hypothetical protein
VETVGALPVTGDVIIGEQELAGVCGLPSLLPSLWQRTPPGKCRTRVGWPSRPRARRGPRHFPGWPSNK